MANLIDSEALKSNRDVELKSPVSVSNLNFFQENSKNLETRKKSPENNLQNNSNLPQQVYPRQKQVKIQEPDPEKMSSARKHSHDRAIERDSEHNQSLLKNKKNNSVRNSGAEMRIQMQNEMKEKWQTDTYDRHGFIIKKDSNVSQQSSSRSGTPGPGPNLNEEAIDLKTLRQRELKWLAMLDKWDKSIKKDKDKVKSRCLKGLPLSLRGKIWTFCTGSYFIYNHRTSNKQLNAMKNSNSRQAGNSNIMHSQTSAPGLSNYSRNESEKRSISSPDPPNVVSNKSSLFKSASEQHPNVNSGSVITFDFLLSQNLPDVIASQIESDLHRQFPENELFRRYSEIATTDLRRVLHAYWRWYLEVTSKRP